MGTLELKKELHKYIEAGNHQFLNALYKSAKTYIKQKRVEEKIAEGEKDIKEGRVVW